MLTKPETSTRTIHLAAFSTCCVSCIQSHIKQATYSSLTPSILLCSGWEVKSIGYCFSPSLLCYLWPTTNKYRSVLFFATVYYHNMSFIVPSTIALLHRHGIAFLWPNARERHSSTGSGSLISAWTRCDSEAETELPGAETETSQKVVRNVFGSM